MAVSNVVVPDFFQVQNTGGETTAATSAKVAAFEEFWKWYPLHKKKPAARTLFMKITSPGGYDTRTLDKDSGTYLSLHLEATPEEIIEGAKRFWKSLPKVSQNSYARDTAFCPHPTTWLNQGRWDDD